MNVAYLNENCQMQIPIIFIKAYLLIRLFSLGCFIDQRERVQR